MQSTEAVRRRRQIRGGVKKWERTVQRLVLGLHWDRGLRYGRGSVAPMRCSSIRRFSAAFCFASLPELRAVRQHMAPGHAPPPRLAPPDPLQEFPVNIKLLIGSGDLRSLSR